jgi:hypothetical protein
MFQLSKPQYQFVNHQYHQTRTNTTLTVMQKEKKEKLQIHRDKKEDA